MREEGRTQNIKKCYVVCTQRKHCLVLPKRLGSWLTCFQKSRSHPTFSVPEKGRWNKLKCDSTRAETRFRLSAKRTSPFKSVGGRQCSRLLAAEVCASAVVMLDTPCSEVVWRVLATHCIRQFPLHFPSRASPCAITCQMESASLLSDAFAWVDKKAYAFSYEGDKNCSNCAENLAARGIVQPWYLPFVKIL